MGGREKAWRDEWVEYLWAAGGAAAGLGLAVAVFAGSGLGEGFAWRDAEVVVGKQEVTKQGWERRVLARDADEGWHGTHVGTLKRAAHEGDDKWTLHRVDGGEPVPMRIGEGMEQAILDVVAGEAGTPAREHWLDLRRAEGSPYSAAMVVAGGIAIIVGGALGLEGHQQMRRRRRRHEGSGAG